MVKIKSYSYVTHNLDIPTFFQFSESVIDSLTPVVANTVELQPRFQLLKTAFTKLDEGFKWPKSAPETEKLAQINKKIEGVIMLIEHRIHDLSLYSLNEAKKASARILQKEIMDNYAGARKAAYEPGTALTTNMLQDLDKPENKEHINRLGLTEEVDTLKALKTEFQALYVTRYNKRYAHKRDGNTTQLRAVVIEEFDKFCKAASGLQLAVTDPAILSNLDEAAIIINAAIEQFTIVLNRHLRETSSNGNGDFEKPDITNPEVPEPPEPGEPGGTDPENPDIENPPLPPFLPDFE
ncbi:hypothetical protein FACS189435_3360 [Bacteroidia bacterium]|nr:hypothetical protein FACS189435_3360 [Bacteroidia bacterium]